MTRINNNTTPQDRDENPGKAGARKYGIVRLRIVFDDKRADMGEDFIVYQVYDPNKQEWVEIDKDTAEDIAERGRDVMGGLIPNGFHLTYAIPSHRIGEYGRYVIEWVDGKDLPRKPLTVHENVEIIILGKIRGKEF